MSPESKLGHLGASLGNQAFHTVASQQQQQAVAAGTQQDLSKVAAAGTQRFQSSFQSTWKKINEQRMAAMKKKKKKNEKKLHFDGGGVGAASGSSNNNSSEANSSGDGDAGGGEATEKRTTTSTKRAPATTSAVPSMEDMMGLKKEKNKNMNHNLKVTEEQGGLVKLTNEQRAYFELHPDLLQQFQQQQIDLIQSKKDEDAVKKALFGNIGEAPPPSDSRYFFL